MCRDIDSDYLMMMAGHRLTTCQKARMPADSLC